MKIRMPSHATVVAYIALFAAFGGSAYAVSRVGTGDLKPNAVTSPKIENGTIKASDLNALRLRRGRTLVPVGATGMQSATAQCRKNERMVTGGGGWIGDGNLTSALSASLGKRARYEVRGTNPDGSADTLLALAICLRR